MTFNLNETLFTRWVSLSEEGDEQTTFVVVCGSLEPIRRLCRKGVQARLDRVAWVEYRVWRKAGGIGPKRSELEEDYFPFIAEITSEPPKDPDEDGSDEDEDGSDENGSDEERKHKRVRREESDDSNGHPIVSVFEKRGAVFECTAAFHLNDTYDVPYCEDEVGVAITEGIELESSVIDTTCSVFVDEHNAEQYDEDKMTLELFVSYLSPFVRQVRSEDVSLKCQLTYKNNEWDAYTEPCY